jgi:glycoside/pentoside/hexuronide:cation symporter, GPH family
MGTTEPVAALQQDPTTTARLGWANGLHYGLMGAPIAFAALPLYVVLPHWYSTHFGLSLSVMGALLLGTRLFDAMIDPWMGRASDRLFAAGAHRVLSWALAAATVLALGFTGLMLPPVRQPTALLAWAATLLILTYSAWSLLGLLHQGWGTRLGGSDGVQARLVAWREGMGLPGVIVASLLPAMAGMGVTAGALAGLLLVAWMAWRRAPAPHATPQGTTLSLATAGSPNPWRQAGFAQLWTVFMLNGTASAIPATLVLFFVNDKLQAPAGSEGGFLALYFLAAAAAMPGWLMAVRRVGLARTWLGGMLLSIAAFGSAAWLGAGDTLAFYGVCAASGLALGADLSVPTALLARLIARNGHQGRYEGAYLGWWNWGAKLNLALAAGLALPLLSLLGYTPGLQNAQGLQALGLSYAVLPCALKVVAALLLLRWIAQTTAPDQAPQGVHNPPPHH